MIFKVANIILSALMLLSTNGFRISQHFCHDRLASVSLFVPANGCGDEMTSTCCPGEAASHCKDASLDAENCCENLNGYVKFSGQFAPEKTFSGIAASVVILQTNGLFELFSVDYSSVIFTHPVLLIRDIPVLIQSFLL